MSRPLFGRNPSRRPRGVRPLLEALEDRSVPSTTASSNGAGVLTISTNSAATGIVVLENGTPGSYTVVAPDLVGAPSHSLTFSRITGIVVNASGGNDALVFLGDNGGTGPEPNPSTVLTGGLSVTTTGTLDVLVGPYFNAAGSSTFTEAGRTTKTGKPSIHVTVSGIGASLCTVTVNGGACNDSFTLTDGATITNNLTLSLGAGNNAITLGDTSAGGTQVNVTGNVNIAGKGNDVITMLDASINGFVSATGTGNEIFTIGSAGDPVKIGQYLSINDPNAKQVIANIDNLTTGGFSNGFLSITSGAGNDSVCISDSNIGQNLGLFLGGGFDTVCLNNDQVGGWMSVTGSGVESIAVANLFVNSFASFNEAASKALAIDVNNSDFNSYLAIIGGAGNDVATVRASQVVGNLAVELDGGNNDLGLSGDVVRGNTTLNAGSGADNFFIQDTTFNGSAAIGLGGGHNVLNVQTTSGTSTQFFGPTTIATGVGSSTVNLGSPGAGGEVIFYDAGAPSSNTPGVSQVFLEGGGSASNDTLNQIDVNYFGGFANISGFKHVTG